MDKKQTLKNSGGIPDSGSSSLPKKILHNFVAYYVLIMEWQKKFQEKKNKTAFLLLKVAELDVIGVSGNWERVWHWWRSWWF